MTNGNGIVPKNDVELTALLAASPAYVQTRRAEEALIKPTAAAPQTDRQAGQPEEHHNAPEVYRAISQVAKAIGREGVSKDGKNQQQGYSFRGIDAIFNALSPLLAGADLCILPRMVSRNQEERPTAKGGVLFYVTVQADFDFVSSRDGSRHTVTMFGEGMDSADKATNKAMSAAYKYACLQVFCIPTEGMVDADATTPRPAPKPASAPSPAPGPELVKSTKPWTTFAEMLVEFGKVQELLPAETSATIFQNHGVGSAADFRRGPTQRKSDNSRIALDCYQEHLKAAADYLALAQNPTTYEHFKSMTPEAWL